jgi:hypothetical protein
MPGWSPRRCETTAFRGVYWARTIAQRWGARELEGLVGGDFLLGACQIFPAVDI